MDAEKISGESGNHPAAQTWNLRDHLQRQHGVPVPASADAPDDALGAYHLGLHNPFTKTNEPDHTHDADELVADSPILQDLLGQVRAVELGGPS